MLTEIACKAAICSDGKLRTRFTDAGGLYLEVTPNGAKRWFWKYRFAAKEKRLSLGSYPAIKLKDARLSRDDARRLLSQGSDPVQRRKIDRATARVNAGTTFEKVAREFHALKVKEWSDTHFTKWIRLQESNLLSRLPVLGKTLSNRRDWRPRTTFPCQRGLPRYGSMFLGKRCKLHYRREYERNDRVMV